MLRWRYGPVKAEWPAFDRIKGRNKLHYTHRLVGCRYFFAQGSWQWCFTSWMWGCWYVLTPGGNCRFGEWKSLSMPGSTPCIWAVWYCCHHAVLLLWFMWAPSKSCCRAAPVWAPLQQVFFKCGRLQPQNAQGHSDRCSWRKRTLWQEFILLPVNASYL